MNSMEYVAGTPRHQLPVISSHMVPVPPPPLQKGDRSLNAVRNRVPRGRRFRPTTAPNGLEQLLTKNSGGFPKPSLRSNVFVTMVFLGKSVHLSHDGAAYRDEIKVYQQHCGGENLCVYKGKLLEGETFQFVSKRHHGFPFSLTFFLNGMQVDRLSCCCEYKHQKRSRLGGRHGYFGFLSVEGASPCYRCIIAMGLDKKPSPPKRKMEDHEENPVGSWRNGEHSEPNKSSVEQKSSKASLLVIIPGHEASVETYDEDFEADEEVNEVGQTGDQMNGMSKSSSDDKLHNLDYENESKTSSQKALQASDSEKEQSDGYSDSNSEDDKRDGRAAHSVSSISTQYSSDNDSDAETMEDDVKGKEDHNIKTASDDAEHAQYGNESRENKLLRMEENQETFTLEKEGIDEAEKAEAEDLTVREDTGIFDENIMAIEQQSPEVPGELKQAGSGEGDIREDGEKNASARRDDGKESLLVPLESNVMQGEDSNEGSPRGDGEGGEYSPPVELWVASSCKRGCLCRCPGPRCSTGGAAAGLFSGCWSPLCCRELSNHPQCHPALLFPFQCFQEKALAVPFYSSSLVSCIMQLL
uniref:DUF4590 domain-containing protein n=1 Tax=Calidris pygmaea TaxID=425635 RepID=A0A8C3KC78_9CHAR